MPLNPLLKKVLVIGSGPIVIGQAVEFDYAGAQACIALKEEGLEVVLINSNPATIMTDKTMADEIYIEPLTPETVKRIIKKEKPDALLSTMGGQTGLTLSMQLAKEGFLEEHKVTLLGASPNTIDKAEDRQIFKETMEQIGEPVIPSAVVQSVEDALSFAGEAGYPVIVRPAFTLGGAGGGIAGGEQELMQIAAGGLRQSPISQILVEKGISGWKEIEFEVMRDSHGNVITVCSMENFDPVGIHTGDSIVVAPTVTLADREYQMLRTAALHIIAEMGIEGGCNCQFALKPDSFDYAVIEVNPRVSRSSALASKATGYPIARVATKIAVGYTLDEIENSITKKTFACFEPALDYVVVKLPKWPFDKFVYAKRTLGTQMKATGEVMAIGRSFEEALMKAVRGAELPMQDLRLTKLTACTDTEISEKLWDCDDERLFVIYEAICRGISLSKIHDITGIDSWFLAKLKNLSEMEARLCHSELSEEIVQQAKRLGFPDSTIRKLSGKIPQKLPPAFKMVDTCGGEFAAETPYFYASADEEDEAREFIREHDTGKQTVIVFGSGPIRIGQGIEFDYACVHCVWALKRAGFDVVIVNNNPETVSTDFHTADRLYFEPLTPEDVSQILSIENPCAAVVAFGGQTAIKLTKFLEQAGVRILGTSADSIDRAEDRERFDALLEELSVKRPKGDSVLTVDEAVAAAHRLTYPVLLRPSYVLGGQNMIIAFSDADIMEYMEIILAHKIENPVLIDKYLMGMELEVDAICDGEDILIPGVMEHIERAGIHSGDSIAVYPAWNLSAKQLAQLMDYTKKLALSLQTRGLINIQYVMHNGELFVIEVNPRSSRTIPYISKVTGVPMVDLAVRCMLGEKLGGMGYGVGLYPPPAQICVKVPVFSFEKLAGLDNQLGPEMKSTGEVLGIGKTLDEALYKGLIAAGYQMKRKGGILITVRDTDKAEVTEVAESFAELGFTIYATEGTAIVLEKHGLTVRSVSKIHEASENTKTLLESGKISYILSTSAKGRLPARDSVKLRRKAIELGIPCLTSLDTAAALANSLKSGFTQQNTKLFDLNHMDSHEEKRRFVKMEECGNDYLYFDCFSQMLPHPKEAARKLSDRRSGVGSDGIILICPSNIADAKMRIFNADGSERKMCGNGIRCVGKYLYDSGIVRQKQLTVETLSGIKNLSLLLDAGKVTAVSVQMGAPILTPAKIPVLLDGERIVDREILIEGAPYRITCVSMGNPHCIVFTKNVDNLNLKELGPEFEKSGLFPEGVNTEFVEVLSQTEIKIRVWERSSQEAFACGTGACAAAVASILNGYCQEESEIKVHLKGGILQILQTSDDVFMTGAANTVFWGEVIIDG